MNNYTELEVWIKSRHLVNAVYDLTKKFPAEELYTLGSQMKRAAISVPSNFAEGLWRNT